MALATLMFVCSSAASNFQTPMKGVGFLAVRAVGHAQPQPVHVASIDNRAERRTARRVIHHVNNQPGGESGSGSAPVINSSLPPCPAPAASEEFDEGIDIGRDTGALEVDSVVVTLPHHTVGHPHPTAHRTLHPHPAAHAVRVDERAERRTGRRVIHHAGKHSSGSSGSSSATTSLPPCQSIADAEADEDVAIEEDGEVREGVNAEYQHNTQNDITKAVMV